jgi:uncharacterized RDD family membrane protein YckC
VALSSLLNLEEPEERLAGAGFWIRALARTVDILVHYGVALVVGIVAVLLVAVGAAIRGVPADATLHRLGETNALNFITALLGGTAVHTFCEGLHGSTIGKRLCGLTVIGEDGRPAGLLAALKRNVAYYLDALFFGFIAARKMAESPLRQRIGDVWAGTQVVRIGDLPPAARRSWIRFGLAVLAGLGADAVVIFVGLGLGLL